MLFRLAAWTGLVAAFAAASPDVRLGFGDGSCDSASTVTPYQCREAVRGHEGYRLYQVSKQGPTFSNGACTVALYTNANSPVAVELDVPAEVDNLLRQCSTGSTGKSHGASAKTENGRFTLSIHPR